MYWFPAKRYGWGWGWPSSWQGWVVLAAFFGLLGVASFLFPPKQSLGAFLVSVLVLAALLLPIFIPVHYALWHKFPAWYHVLFIASLVLFTLLGAMRRLPR